ncbi:hypothetical protein [Hyphomonas sp.]|uniref:hypothetical protein n=1 Tax=Hyphomonas sp. TaxID=87 RepID=UPI0025C01C9D|nr:hypothetical protein [Hyphomonas sp.]
MKFPWQRSDSEQGPSAPGGPGFNAGAVIDSTAQRLGQLGAAAKALPIFASVPMFSLAVFVTISFIGTYTGMLEVLQSGDNSFGFWGVTGVFLFIFATTIIMAYSVSEMFRSGRDFWPRVSLVITYIVTLLISVSFGFAFYWTQLEARTQAVGDAERYLTVFDREITVADTQLAGTLATLTTLNTNFTALSAAERESGNQCGEVSGGGDGPRTRHLAARAGEINALVMALTPQIASVRTEAEVVRTSIETVRELGAKGASEVTPAQREEVFRAAAGAANKAGATLEALATSQSVQNYITNLRTWAGEYGNPSLTRVEEGTGTPFKCYNTTIASQLNGVAADLEALPVLPISELDSYAGAAATREALDRFWFTLTAPLRGLVDGPQTQTETEREEAVRRDAIREALGTRTDEAASDKMSSMDVKELVEGQQGLRRNDALPLGLAIVIDALLFLSALWSQPTEKFAAFSRMMRELRGEKERPLALVQGAHEIQDNPDFSFLRPYVFTHFDEVYLALPVSGTLAEEQATQILNTLRIAWQAGKIIKRASVSSATIERQLAASGSRLVQKPQNDNEVGPGARYEEDMEPVAASPLPLKLPKSHANFVAYRFLPGAFEQMVLQAMIPDMPGAEDEARGDAERRPEA